EAEPHPEGDTARADLLTGAAEDCRLLAAVPGDAAVAKERDLDRHGPVHSALDAEGAQQRESELQVAHANPPPNELIGGIAQRDVRHDASGRQLRERRVAANE